MENDINIIKFRADNCHYVKPTIAKNDFLILGEGDTFSMNESFGALKKNKILILVKTKFFLSPRYNSDNSYLFVDIK